MVTMGCSIDSFDVCFGTQIVDSRGDIGGNLCIGVDACFHPCYSSRNLGALFEVLCVGLNIMNLNFALVLFYYKLLVRSIKNNSFMLF